MNNQLDLAVSFSIAKGKGLLLKDLYRYRRARVISEAEFSARKKDCLLSLLKEARIIKELRKR